MFSNSCCHYQWHNPMHNNWNNNWSYNWNPYYYNWNHNNWNPYYGNIELGDYGTRPFVVNIHQVTMRNNTYRTALWTGKHLQVTLMSINVGDDIGLEVHPTTDQFIRIEAGQGLVQMGDRKDNLDFQEMAYDGYAIMIPAGKWHNVTNTGSQPLKIYVIYAPPQHPYGTVHETKAIAMASERNY
ncbi:cupin domain-containing protein [Aneurinibacillus sp. Ricciae_BoGa-3]|uniref:cupin domain-containing protein n=1 Tax=Aneurinibacillus sp. Ricciae_BoGa-3 TaxID=3022697 RepID=UPI002341C5C4|nr:cupin domain-containing protein [Aneurinibacillus sp. Ricciae_BoGa-3]WCK53906.1 cupin domain-containing protein [Aneurinibacillus sp. Ricciae_BoGa-3]